jgi:hypothetical protein
MSVLKTHTTSHVITSEAIIQESLLKKDGPAGLLD